MDGRPPDELPNDVRAFLYSCIDSVEQVEILTLLGRSSRSWSARAVGQKLGLQDSSARHHLETLVARGLLQTAISSEVAYRYAPKSADLRRYADQLTEYYGTARTAIVRFLTTSPKRAKRFSDAFRLRDPEQNAKGEK
jgi:predicted ArsR family transcriptional regulator